MSPSKVNQSIYSSSDEETATQNPMTDQELTNCTNDKDEQWLNQYTIHPNDRTDTVEVTNPTFDVNMVTLTSPATTESQQSKHQHNVSPATTEYHFKSGPNPIELGRVSLTRVSPESPTPFNKGPAKLFRPWDVADTPPRPII